MLLLLPLLRSMIFCSFCEKAHIHTAYEFTNLLPDHL